MSSLSGVKAVAGGWQPSYADGTVQFELATRELTNWSGGQWPSELRGEAELTGPRVFQTRPKCPGICSMFVNATLVFSTSL